MKWRVYLLHASLMSKLDEIDSLATQCINLIIFFLLVSSTIEGRIDQVNQVLELNQQRQGTARYNALDNWTYQLSSLHLAIANKMA